VIETYKLERFIVWLDGLPDPIARRRILARVRRLSLGNPGDVRPVGAGVSELRIDWGPGYRVYFVTRGATRIILLGGGTKQTQRRDIRDAQLLARDI
jgi:putative addiction module killer protein